MVYSQLDVLYLLPETAVSYSANISIPYAENKEVNMINNPNIFNEISNYFYKWPCLRGSSYGN